MNHDTTRGAQYNSEAARNGGPAYTWVPTPHVCILALSVTHWQWDAVVNKANRAEKIYRHLEECLNL